MLDPILKLNSWKIFGSNYRSKEIWTLTLGYFLQKTSIIFWVWLDQNLNSLVSLWLCSTSCHWKNQNLLYSPTNYRLNLTWLTAFQYWVKWFMESATSLSMIRNASRLWNSFENAASETVGTWRNGWKFKWRY